MKTHVIALFRLEGPWDRQTCPWSWRTVRLRMEVRLGLPEGGLLPVRAMLKQVIEELLPYYPNSISVIRDAAANTTAEAVSVPTQPPTPLPTSVIRRRPCKKQELVKSGNRSKRKDGDKRKGRVSVPTLLPTALPASVRRRRLWKKQPPDLCKSGRSDKRKGSDRHVKRKKDLRKRAGDRHKNRHIVETTEKAAADARLKVEQAATGKGARPPKRKILLKRRTSGARMSTPSWMLAL